MPLLQQGLRQALQPPAQPGPQRRQEHSRPHPEPKKPQAWLLLQWWRMTRKMFVFVIAGSWQSRALALLSPEMRRQAQMDLMAEHKTGASSSTERPVTRKIQHPQTVAGPVDGPAEEEESERSREKKSLPCGVKPSQTIITVHWRDRIK